MYHYKCKCKESKFTVVILQAIHFVEEIATSYRSYNGVDIFEHQKARCHCSCHLENRSNVVALGCGLDIESHDWGVTMVKGTHESYAQSQ